MICIENGHILIGVYTLHSCNINVHDKKNSKAIPFCKGHAHVAFPLCKQLSTKISILNYAVNLMKCYRNFQEEINHNLGEEKGCNHLENFEESSPHSGNFLSGKMKLRSRFTIEKYMPRALAVTI